MFIPRVNFKNIPMIDEVDLIHCFLVYNNWGWEQMIIKRYPGIKGVYEIKTRKEQLKFIHKYVSEFRKNNKDDIKIAKEKYQKLWKKVEKDYFVLLSEILQIEWPKRRKKIYALMSINPICPRFLREWSFSIFYNYKKDTHPIEVIMHECCHFLYFKKWKELYPEVKEKTFEEPYLEWHLSEIVAPIILNDDRVQKLLKQKAVFYEVYEKMTIKNKTVPKYFTELYENNINKSNGFEIFIKKAYEDIKLNEKLFNI